MMRTNKLTLIFVMVAFLSSCADSGKSNDRHGNKNLNDSQTSTERQAEDKARKDKEASDEIQASLSRAEAAANLADPTYLEQNQENLKNSSNPYGVKQYDLTEEAIEHTYNEFGKSISEGFIRTAIDNAEILLNQRDQELRSQAEKELSPYFVDGIIQMGLIGKKKLSLLDKSKFSTNRNTPEGQALRYVINKAQIAWSETHALRYATDRGISSYLMSAISIRTVDDYFAHGQKEKGYALLAIADALANLTYGAPRGAIHHLAEKAQAIPVLTDLLTNYGQAMLDDPDEALEISGLFVHSLPGVSEAFLTTTLQPESTLANYTSEKRDKIIEDIAGTLLMSIIVHGSNSVIQNGAKILKDFEKSTRIGQVAGKIGVKVLIEAKK